MRTVDGATCPWRKWLLLAGLLIGFVEAAGVALWCVAGAGMYGSPLQVFSGAAQTRLFGSFLCGPLLVLPALLIELFRPRRGALLLLVAWPAGAWLDAMVEYADPGATYVSERASLPADDFDYDRWAVAAALWAGFALPNAMLAWLLLRAAPLPRVDGRRGWLWALAVALALWAGAVWVARPRVHVWASPAGGGPPRPMTIDELAQLPPPLTLELMGPAITNADLAQLESLPGVRSVRLTACSVSDTGLAALARVRGLEEVSLTDVDVGDPGLATLAAAPTIRTLSLANTLATVPFAVAIAQERPGLQLAVSGTYGWFNSGDPPGTEFWNPPAALAEPGRP